MTAETVELTGWVGRTQETSAEVTPGLDGILRGVLGIQEDPHAGLLHGLHWLLFDRFVPAAETGPDGHPRRGGFLPPIELPRRMWAGSRIEFVGSLREGTRVTRRSRISALTPKEGRTGPLVFVTVEHEVLDDTGVVIREQQDIVYRDIGPSAPRPTPAEFAREGSWSMTFRPDEVTLFRYSALTHNSHRIHYDGQYARETELYPALVVHGPLTATMVMWATATCAGAPLRSFAFRGQQPLYVNDDIHVDVSRDGSDLRATARNVAGAAAMSATATVRP